MSRNLRTKDWEKIKYFTPKEIEDSDHPGSWKYMAKDTLFLLDKLRAEVNAPIIVHNNTKIKGAVAVNAKGHALTSRHYPKAPARPFPPISDAIDWHFKTDLSPRLQAMAVLQSGFTGIGIYYYWHWNNQPLSIGFHTDLRAKPQIWTEYEKHSRIYLLP